MRAAEEALRRSIATATDGRVRAGLRVQLAEIVRARDTPAARDELGRAAREAEPTPAFTLAALSLARALAPADRIVWLGELARAGERTPSPLLVSALAAAQLGSGYARDAALTWLGLARDARAPMPHRRSAARKAARIADRLRPDEARAAIDLAADLGAGRPRRPTALVEVPPAAVGVAPPFRFSPTEARTTPRPRRDPASVLEGALAEARAGHANRARRLGEAAIRLSAPGVELASRVAALDTALREGGFMKDALLLRRAHLEALDIEAARPALVALAAEAAEAGLSGLAADWLADAGAARAPAVAPVGENAAPRSPAEHYLAAQRLLARDGQAADPTRILAALEQALAGHPGADTALALAERIAERMAVDGADLAGRRLALLRAAQAAEREPQRRARLGRRLAAALESGGDAIGAVAVLEGVLAEARPGDGERVRAERARLLRGLGRSRDLAAALERDAGALAGEARLAVLVEHATLLESAGEAEKALDVRLMALAEFPGAAVLDEARRRLEATGRGAESLALARTALEHTTEPARRGQLLRDIAILTEQAGASANPSAAASAWLAVLEVDAGDARATAAAERFLVATGDWERCADLLAWQASRGAAESDVGGAAAVYDRVGLLWRLAELRRSRLGQPGEALRLYSELLAASGSPLGSLGDSPALAAVLRHNPALAVETARAAAAPSAVERSRALVDRSRAFAELGRADDAERDALAALDLDPRNMEALALLEKLFEGPARARLLADELGRRAAKLAPPVAAPLFYGRGRAAERAGDDQAAREAYRRAMSFDPTLAEPIAALAALAARQGDWSEVVGLLESEAGLATSPARKGALLLELAVVHGDRLDNPTRAVSLLAAAALHLRDEPRVLDLSARFNLAAGDWQAAAEALDRLAARAASIPDAAARYYAVGAAAEAAGEIDRALTLYSRSYARDGSFRPTLERLSTICFERGQWDNTWKATEALLDRHGPALEPSARAGLLARSILADLHLGQRAVAIAKLGEIVTRGPSYSPESGIRDVAESWAGMHLEPRLLAGVELRRRERAFQRAWEILTIEPRDGGQAAARQQAMEILGALAMVEGRWDDLLAALDALASTAAFAADRRAEFLLAAADVVARRRGDRAAASLLYDRARALSPGHPRWQRIAESSR